MDNIDNSAAPAPTDGRRPRWIAGLLLAFAALEVLFSRVHFLDDAFIHLRIAHRLAEFGRFEYNTGAAGFVTSSPLYTVILALFSLGSHSPLVLKVENILAYAVVLALIVKALCAAGQGMKTALLCGALTVAVSPLGVRWLTDGMETGTVMLMALLLASAVNRASRRAADAVATMDATAWAAAVGGAGAVFLRVEFGYLLAVAVTVVSVCVLTRPAMPGDMIARLRRAGMAALPFIIGGLAGTALIFGLFHHLLPDTAVAKRIHADPLLTTFRNIAAAHAGASFFGVGMFTLWAVSTVAAYRAGTRQTRPCVLTANASMVVFLLLLIITHQAIQGIRYFVFIETFLTALNILALPDIEQPLHARRLAGGMVFLTLIWISYDAKAFYRISQARSATFRRFATGNYDYLRNKEGVAYDIGFVGYFGRAYILDVHGLVNGRDAAKHSDLQRLVDYAREPVDFVFVNDGQFQEVSGKLDLAGWKDVGHFDFTNFDGQPDTHRLLVRPAALPLESHHD